MARTITPAPAHREGFFTRRGAGGEGVGSVAPGRLRGASAGDVATRGQGGRGGRADLGGRSRPPPEAQARPSAWESWSWLPSSQEVSLCTARGGTISGGTPS